MPGDAELAYGTIAGIGKLFRQRKLSPVELTKVLLERIERLNPSLNAYLTVSADVALEQAKRAEAELLASKRGKKSDRGPLQGIPISLKDNIYTKEIRTTAGSKILGQFVPLRDAPLVTGLKEAGAVILGKTSMHEFAYGLTAENPHYGPARNPWDLERVTGGSSGGSAGALAAGLCFGSIGTDTGGSVRVPASLCGIVGMKPGLGRVMADDVVPLSPTQDFVGPMARTVEDAALLVEPIFIRGRKERGLVPGRAGASRKGRPRLGIPVEFLQEIAIEPEVERALEDALRVMRKRGAKLIEIFLPQLSDVEEAGNLIAWAESTVYHGQAGWFPARAQEYGEDVRSRLEMGTKVSAVSYLRARAFREGFKAALLNVMLANELDAIVMPTTPIAAPRIGEAEVVIDGQSHSARSLLLKLNRPANLAGVPAISVPCGPTKRGLPIGLQFVTAWTDEPKLFAMARNFEREYPINARPKIALS